MLLKVSIKKEPLQILSIYRNKDCTSQPMNRMYSCIKLHVLYIVGSQRLLSFIINSAYPLLYEEVTIAQ